MTIPGPLADRARRIRLMLFDVDGVMTDGTLYVGEAGEAMKGFHVRDGLGLQLLRDAGVEVGIITSRRSPIVEVRAAELGITLLRQGERDKAKAFGALLAERRLAADEAGYMGDDLVDLPVLMRCGFSATVPDAPEAVKGRVQYVSSAPGGRGAVREVCELLLAARGALDEAVGRFLR